MPFPYAPTIYKTNETNSCRYVLGSIGKRPLCVIGLNPSTADDRKADQTIAKIMGFAQRNGFDAWMVFNLYPQRTPYPDRLVKRQNTMRSRQNTEVIASTLGRMQRPTLLAAWGDTIVIRPYLASCLDTIVSTIAPTDPRWVKIGALTKTGHPRHPSRAPYAFGLTDFDVHAYLKSLALVLLLIPQLVFGQLFGAYQVAVINDTDGFTLVREQPNTTSNVVDTVYDHAFFHFVANDTSDWVSVSTWNTNGFMHKSRVKGLRSLSRKAQRTLLLEVFDKELSIHQGLTPSEVFPDMNSIGFHDARFIPILDLFIHYQCRQFDEKLMRLFFDVLIVEIGSADETPPTALGHIHNCHPERLDKLEALYDNEHISNMLELGKAYSTH
jgi:hypothetical protein